jgi:hypothetical protein
MMVTKEKPMNPWIPNKEHSLLSFIEYEEFLHKLFDMHMEPSLYGLYPVLLGVIPPEIKRDNKVEM